MAITAKNNVNTMATWESMLPYARDHYLARGCDVRPNDTFVDLQDALQNCIGDYAGGDASLLRADVCICTSCNDAVRSNEDCYIPNVPLHYYR